ncbi:MAG TPA: transcriptional repressor [Thermoanaerobaculia bacterium]|nr:transcriptional repressor [Thermoanaerobaculia bacterium]
MASAVHASPARRSTRQKRLVLEVVCGTKTHPTAEWVYEAVRRELPRVSLGTVYRNLQRLVEEGKLRSFEREGRIRYEADLALHDHFSCDRCGLLVDIARGPEPLPGERRLKAQGFTIAGRTLEFHGLCRKCRRGAAANA